MPEIRTFFNIGFCKSLVWAARILHNGRGIVFEFRLPSVVGRLSIHKHHRNMSNQKSRTWIVALCIAALLAAGTSLSARAGHGHQIDGEYQLQKDQRKERRKERSRGRISLDEAAARVRKQTGGRVLSADTTSSRNGAVHRIKVLLPSGRVRVYLVDAATAELR